MSIRTNPMKAVPVLLKRVKTARTKFMQNGIDDSFDGKLEKLRRELNKIEDVFMKVKKNQDALLDTLHDVDSHLRNLDRTKLDQDMDGICTRIRDCAHKLLPMESFGDDSSDNKNGKTVQSSSPYPSSTERDNHSLLDHFENLSPQIRRCLLSLSIFPKDAVIRKSQAIYLWIGALNIAETEEKTAEEVGEDVIDELRKSNLIEPYGSGSHFTVKKFRIHPHIHHHLDSSMERETAEHLGLYFQLQKPHPCSGLVLKQRKVMLGDGVPLKTDQEINSIFNVGASYLNFGSQWLDKKTYLNVLHLGRWQDSPSHHIEVGSLEFLNDLSNLNGLVYLSLRGISRVSELPPSIGQLEWLEILDLKACHNLETLPNDISSMKNLTHLILSQCYLLNGMPEGIEELTQLQVLKGFVVGSYRKTPCRISHLARLKKLKRLSIHIGREAVIEDEEFGSLGELSALEHLKISWGVSDARYGDIPIILPPGLKKLHLECFPGRKIPEWLKPSKLPRALILPCSSSEILKDRKPLKILKELIITGGKLESLNHNEVMNKWAMQIVRLKYLPHFKFEIGDFRELFPLLRYIEIKKVSNYSDKQRFDFN